jgi:hypothetical protein
MTIKYSLDSEQQGQLGRNGVTPEGGQEAPAARAPWAFTKSAFEAMREDPDIAPSVEERDESYIPLGRVGKTYCTIHPDPAYELCGAFTPDFRKADGKADPYLVMRHCWNAFPLGFLRVKRLVLAQSFVDESLRSFLWLGDWVEHGEALGEFHRSVDRVIKAGRRGWIQAPFVNGIYQVMTWPAHRLGEPPSPIWPDRDMFSIVEETFRDRIIGTPDHELILALGEVAR